MAEKAPREKIKFKDIVNRNLILILLIQIFANMSLNTVSTLFNVGARGAGISVAALGIAASAYSIAALVVRMPAGALANSTKKKIALIGVLAFRVVTQWVIGTFGLTGDTQFVIGRIVYGIGWSFGGIVLPAVVAMMMDKKVMGFTYAIFTIVNNLTKNLIKAPAQAMFKSAVDAGATASAAMVKPLLLSAILEVVAIVLVLFLDFNDERVIRATPKKQKSMLKNFNFRYAPIALLLSLVVFTWNMSNTYDQTLGTERGIDMVSVLAVSGVISSFIGFVTSAACDIIHPKWVLVFLYLCLGGGAFLMGGATTYTPFLIGFCLAVIGKSYSQVISIYLYKNCAEDQKATVHATNYLMTDILSIFSGTVVGAILQSMGYEGGYKVFAIVALVCCVLVALFADKLMAFANSGTEKAEEEA